MDWLIAGLIGFVVGGVVLWYVNRARRSGPTPQIAHSIQQLRAVGELVVFRLITQQIVTAEEHPVGNFGRNYLKWLLSNRKMAMVIEYSMDFSYDLRDPSFVVRDDGEGRYTLKMPPCSYQAHIRNIKFYDEQGARWLPWLLGNVTGVLGPGFDETDKNRLIEAARQEADKRAQDLVEQLETEVHSSARQTLRSLARGFAAEEVSLDFEQSSMVRAGEASVPDALKSAAAEDAT